MIGGFIEQKNIGTLHQRFDDCQTLLPASRQSGRRLFEVVEAGTTECFGEACAALGPGHSGAIQSFLDD